MSGQYRYTTDYHGPFGLKINIEDEGDLSYVAEQAADDFHTNHDGWECSWPRQFKIIGPDDTVLGEFEVDRDVEPVFSAHKLQGEKQHG